MIVKKNLPTNDSLAESTTDYSKRGKILKQKYRKIRNITKLDGGPDAKADTVETLRVPPCVKHMSAPVAKSTFRARHNTVAPELSALF